MMATFSKEKPNEIGFHLMATLIANKRQILITEDLEFLENYFRLTSQPISSNGYLSNIKFKLKTYLLFTSGILVFISALIFRKYSFFERYYSLVTSVCVFLSFLDVGFLITSSLKKYFLCKKFNELCEKFGLIQQHLKIILSSIYEYEAVEQRIGKETINSRVKRSTLMHCKALFTAIREWTLKIRHLPTPFTDIESESNYISSVPFEAFDPLINDEQLPSTYQLKSLIQLIKLQQSELVRRLLCVLNPISQADSCQLIDKIVYLMASLINEIEPHLNKVQMLYVFAKSRPCYVDDERKTRKEINPIFYEFSSSIKLSRIYLQTAFHHLEATEKNIIKMKDSESHSIENTSEIITSLEKSLEEINHCSDNIVTLLKKQKYRLDKSNNAKFDVEDGHNNSETDEQKKPDETVIINTLANDQLIIEDQVFESLLFESDSANDNDQIKREFTVDDSVEKLKMPSLLYEELKSALVPKANEIREREAKVLGVSVDELSNQRLIEQNEIISLKQKREERKEKLKEIDTNANSNNNNNNANKNELINMIGLPKKINFFNEQSSKLFFLTEEQNFGDSIEIEDGDNENSDDNDNIKSIH